MDTCFGSTTSASRRRALLLSDKVVSLNAKADLTNTRFSMCMPCVEQGVMPVQKELSDLEHGPVNAAGSVAMEKALPQTPMEGRKGEDHVLDFNVANFSTPKGKQILHDIGKSELVTG